MMHRYEKSLWINGEWRQAVSGEAIVIRNPATGEVIAEMGYGDVADATTAVEAASEAFASWRQTTARQRSDLLLQGADIILNRAAEIGYILAEETGKRLAEAVGEVRFAAEYFRWFAEEARRPYGELLPNEDAQKRHWMQHQPAGVALCLTPWNFPVSIQARKVAAALAAGCTVVARPSQKAPLSVIELFHCLMQAGFPAGVVNLVHGPAASTSAAMMNHAAVRVVSFTGSTTVGQSLVHLSANRLQRLALELGGNAPFLVYADADIERAVDAAMVAKFRNNGQSCIAANRFYVHRQVYETFVERLASRVRQMKIGEPLAHPEVDLGPMIDAQAAQHLRDCANHAIKLGSVNVCGEMWAPQRDTYLTPQLLVDVPRNSEFATTELFGPAAPIFTFDEDEEAIALANQCDMGLAAYAFTESLSRATHISEELQYGIVGLNHALPSVAFAPMGGVKMSGLGREGGRLGLEEFQEVKYVSTYVGREV